MNWRHPILTDSGGFQIFSLASLRKITEEALRSLARRRPGDFHGAGGEHGDSVGSGVGIAMAFDECAGPSPKEYVRASVERTSRWLERCKTANAQYNAREDAPNPGQVLFGINQGGTFDDLRIDHMKRIAEFDLPGYAIGGLAVGEPAEVMYHILDEVLPYAPCDRPRYLMGVGTPSNILGVARGIDFLTV